MMNSKKIQLSICIVLVSLVFISTISALTIKDVSSSPKEIVPGEVADISIELENIFEYDIESINVKLDLSEVPFAPYQSSSEEFLEKLDEGDEEKIDFKLIALPETSSGIYKIPIQIDYFNDEKIQHKTGLISLIVNSNPELKVSLEDSVVLIKGKENEISIKIVNSGLSDAKFVYLETSDVSGIKVLTNKEQYIGDVDSDDFDSVEYKIHLNSDVSDTISLPIVLKYKDATNKEYAKKETILLRAYSLKEAQRLGLVAKQNYTTYFIIGLPVLAYFGYRFVKKRKLKKRKEE